MFGKNLRVSELLFPSIPAQFDNDWEVIGSEKWARFKAIHGPVLRIQAMIEWHAKERAPLRLAAAWMNSETDLGVT